MTMLNRQSENLSAKFALSEIEMKILDHLKPDKNKMEATLANYILKIAKIGAYLARSSDPPPGNAVLWRGMLRPN
jgi:hypothetical protein